MAERKFLDLEGLQQYDAAVKEVIADGDSAITTALTSGTTVVAKATHAVSADTATTANSANAVAWSKVTGKPSSYTPASHKHAIADVTDLETTLDTINEEIDGSISGLSISGKVITYTKNDGTTGTITIQDTSTDTKVTNTLETTTKAYVTGTTSASTNTGTQVFDTGVYLDTTAGQLVAKTFVGALSGKATSAATADSATSATKATQDANGNVITSTYETKSAASSKLAEAKTYADNAATTVKNELLNGAGEAYDTLKELGDLIDDNQDAIDALEIIAAGKADKSHTHAVTDITGLTATAAELNYMDGVTSNVQTQLDTLTSAVADKAPLVHTHTITASASDDDIVILSGTNGTNKVTYSASHATSGATAGSYGDSSAQTPAYGGTFKVPYVTVNATGHVTGISEHTVKIPANSDTKVTQAVSKIDGDFPVLLRGGTTAGTSTITTTASFGEGILANPSKGTLTATKFVGALEGNATTATTATKVGSSTVGSATQPVYINGGVPTSCTYTLGKSVPSDAKFTDTTYSAGAGISISSARAITNTGVRSIATGTTNGTISVNTNGTSTDVLVKGLAAAAYKGVDTSLSADSTNLVTNKAVATAINSATSAIHTNADSIAILTGFMEEITEITSDEISALFA